MHVRQNLSILFYLKRKKATKDGRIPIYVRITIDGEEDELSLGQKVLPQHWDNTLKKVKDLDPQSRDINKKIEQTRVDIGRHFDLVQARQEMAKPASVKQSYIVPAVGQQRKSEGTENLQLSEALDALITRFLAYSKKREKAGELRDGPSPERALLLNTEKEDIKEAIKEQVKKAGKIFDNPGHQKTFILTINEYFLSFIQLAFTGNRAYTSLEKNMCRKRRFTEFFQYKYKVDDLPLADMKYGQLEEFQNYCMLQHGVKEITSVKHIQFLKEMTDRTVSKGWVGNNVFSLYKCRYREPEPDWLSMEEMMILKDWSFKKEKLNMVRDIFLFGSFTGLSYQELYSLRQPDLVTINGKQWIDKDRRKTGNEEALPLLPVALQILEKYKDHLQCQRTDRLLPVPTNQEYNRRLKEIALELELENIVLRTHKARYFFANEVTFNNGVPLKTVSKMLSHGSVRTTEKYVRPNKRNIAESMEMVEGKLFTEKGELRAASASTQRAINVNDREAAPATKPAGARIIQMR